MSTKAPNPVDKYVGSRVRMRRIMLGMSQEKLGEALGLTFQQVQKYEKGTNRVGASNLFKIAKALGVEVAFFFEGVTLPDLIPTSMPAGLGMAGLADAPAAPFEVNPMNSREAFELMHNYFRIPDPIVRKRLFQLVRTLGFAEKQ